MFSGGVKKQHRAVMTALKALIFLVLQIDVKNSVKKMQWSSSVTRVYFFMESETFGRVAFRGAYKAKSEDRQFRNKQWEIKRYIDPQNDILQVRDSFFQHTQNQVQARKLA